VPTIGLDEFVESLRNSMAKARSDLARTNQGRLERLIELARDGRSEALTWSFVIDEAGGGSQARTVRLPLVTLFPLRAVQVTEAQLDFNVALERRPFYQKKSARSRLRLQLCRPGASLRHRLHQLTVRLTGTEDVTAEILLNGAHFKTVGLEAQSEPIKSSCNATITTKDR
jgi:Protein of unknown function (DUF2589)